MIGRQNGTASNDETRTGARRTTRLFALLALATPLAAMAATAAPAEDAPTLLAKYKCYICHADRETKAGPAYVDVAAHYRGQRNAVALLAREIRRGLKGGSPWHMPPHPEVSPAQAQAIARYIMSLPP
ncbi:MAG: c-type cytochrome [Rudaea sp.]